MIQWTSIINVETDAARFSSPKSNWITMNPTGMDRINCCLNKTARGLMWILFIFLTFKWTRLRSSRDETPQFINETIASSFQNVPLSKLLNSKPVFTKNFLAREIHHENSIKCFIPKSLEKLMHKYQLKHFNTFHVLFFSKVK